MQILVTSREPLLAQGEAVRRLNPLAAPADGTAGGAAIIKSPAVQLFIRRAEESDDRYRFRDEDAALLADVCSRLDGLPLAIELAALSLSSIGLAALRAHLAQPAQLERLMDRSRRCADVRHRTLGAALHWGLERLPLQERRLLRALSGLHGSFTLNTAISLLTDGYAGVEGVVDGIALLVEKSLLEADISDIEPRYRLLQTTRACLGKLLADDPY